VLKLLSTNATIGSLQALGDDEVDGDRPSLTHRRPRYGRTRSSARPGGRGVLAEPDCEALIAGDRRETALTEAMLYRENVHHSLIGDAITTTIVAARRGTVRGRGFNATDFDSASRRPSA
jgi:hypothetical protein